MREIKYDAFISYRHNPFDSAIAERLHKKLERYHIPKVVQQLTGRKKIARVFRDKEELPLTSDLTKDIYEALDHSQCLIVICSPASRESVWVQKEVAYFVGKHGKDRIMTVLTDGEPDTAFPDILCREDSDVSRVIREPLAADVRAVSLQQSLKLLDQEFLRLVAGIIGCSYDGLKRRHRAYQMKCISAISLLVLSILAGISAFSIYKNRQITEYRQASFMREGAFLADQSMQALREGRRTDALSLALAMSDLDETHSFQNPLQAYALNNALYTYRSSSYKEYVPVAESSFDNIQIGCFSSNGQYYFALTEMEYGDLGRNIYVYSGENGDFLYQIDSAPIHEEIEKLKEPFSEFWNLSREMLEQHFLYSNCSGDIQYVIPCKDTKLLLILTDAGCLYDAETKEILHCFLMPSGTILSQNYGSVHQSDSGDLFYYVRSGKGESFVYDIFHQKEISNEALDEMGLSHLFMFDGQIVARTSISDTRQAMLFYREPEERISAIDGLFYNSYYPAVYDSELETFLWMGEKIAAVSTANVSKYSGILFLKLSDEEVQPAYIASWVGKTLALLDADSGTILADITYNANILSVEWASKHSLLVGTESGIVQEIDLSEHLILKNNRLRLSARFSDVDCNSTYDTIAVISNGQVVFSRRFGDSEMTLLDVWGEPPVEIQSVQYVESSNGAYRIVRGKTFDREALLVYPTLTDFCSYFYIVDNEQTDIYDVNVISRDGREILIVVECSEENLQITHIHKIDLDSGTELENTNVEDAGIEKYRTLRFFHDYTKLVTQSANDSIVIVPLSSDDSKIETVQVLPDGVKIIGWEMLPIDDSIVFVCSNSMNEASDKKIYVYYPGDKQAEKIDISLPTGKNWSIEKGLFSNRVAIKCDSEIVIFDASCGLMINRIKLPLGSKDWLQFAFFDQDEYLLVVAEKEVFLYEIKSGNLLSSWSVDIADEHISDLYRYSLTVDKSSTYFALKERAFTTDYEGAWGKRPLIVCYVDNQHKIYPYAKVNYGDVHLNSCEISTSTSKFFQYAPLYDLETLKLRAEAILCEPG